MMGFTTQEGRKSIKGRGKPVGRCGRGDGEGK
jgi:hypothetical protein